jgi:hypothetical protein
MPAPPAGEEEEDPDRGTLSVEESSILRLMLGLGTDFEPCATLLWDLAVSAGAAGVMIAHGALSLLEPLLAGAVGAGQGRAAELCLGMAANLAAHPQGLRQLADADGLAELAADGVLQGSADPGALTEACRLLTAACALGPHCAWRRRLAQPAALERAVWIVANTLDQLLLQRAYDLLTGLLHADPALAPALLQAGLLAALQDTILACVRAFVRAPPASAEDGSGSSGWGEEGEGGPPPGGAGAVVSEEAAVAALTCLEELGGSQAGQEAMLAEEACQLPAALVQLLGAECGAVSEALLLVLVAYRAATTPLLAAQPAALQHLAQALADCDAGSEDACDAAWYLLSSALRHMAQPAGAGGGGGAAPPAAAAWHTPLTLDRLRALVGVLQHAPPAPASAQAYAAATCRCLMEACEGAGGGGELRQAIQRLEARA